MVRAGPSLRSPRNASTPFAISGLAGNFWQNLHTADARGNAKTAFLAIFHSHHRRPATYPLHSALGDFWWQNQHHFQLAAFTDPRVGIEEDPARAQIAGDAGGRNALLRSLNRHLHARRNALPRTTVTPAIWHGVRREGELTTTDGWGRMI